jgi:hypothetical protein
MHILGAFAGQVPLHDVILFMIETFTFIMYIVGECAGQVH